MGRVRASPATRPKASPKAIWGAPDMLPDPVARPKGHFVRRGPIACPVPRGHPGSTGDAAGAPDRPRNPVRSGGPDTSLTQATIAYLSMKLNGAQRQCSSPEAQRHISSRLALCAGVNAHHRPLACLGCIKRGARHRPSHKPYSRHHPPFSLLHIQTLDHGGCSWARSRTRTRPPGLR